MAKKKYKVTDFTQDDHNFNKGTDEGAKLMDKSLKELGAGRSILVDKNGNIIAGNKTQKAAINAGIKEAIVVETTGDKLVVVKRTDIDIDSKEGRELALADNTTGKINFELDEIELRAVDINPMDWGLDIKPFDVETPSINDNENDTDDDPIDDEDDLEKYDFARQMMGDFLYDTDNDFDIPNLLINKQPIHLELPITPWGANSRLKTDVTTYHFYVDDYRFEALFKDPVKLIMSGCRAIVEPNCSLHDALPIPIGLHRIYRKRYLSRYMQECGVKVWVDLNVADKFREYNMMGVPKGYNAFFTRGMSGEWLYELDSDLKVAQEISGLEKPNIVIYGGGKEAKEWAQAHGLLYFADFLTKKDPTGTHQGCQ